MDVKYSKVKRGEIYWVDFGDTLGSEVSGIHPGLIVQNDDGNNYSPTTIVVALTSQKKPNLPTHVMLEKDTLNGLKKNSLITCEQMRTIDKGRLLNKMGMISRAKQKEVDTAMAISIKNLLMEGD
ncbi:type II toxin-antitoxin system PemK/MazF family toxin [bacterium MSK18_59]|jgi:mRNA interferase MazF|nr:type II toxin-antitoxin system PemK/MazF family toxin [bacterium MSK18_59]